MKKTIFLVVFCLMAFTIISCKSEEKKEEKATIVAINKEAQPVKKEENIRPSFNYKPKKPVNGKLKGVVELGASGFNSFIIEVDKDKNWEVQKKEFGNSLISEGLINSQEVNSKLRAYIQQIVEFGVNSKDVHFVVSSGADKEEITQTIKKELKKIGYKVNVVTAEEEGQYALKSVLPKRFEKTGFVVDIGSGNTKVSFIKGEDIMSNDTYGAKYFQKEIPTAKVITDVKETASVVPKSNRMQCFIIGGVPFQMAKSLRVGTERFTVLEKEVTAYKDIVAKKGQKVASGLHIFEGINKETNPNSIIFDWDANFTIGFLLGLPYE